jgi:hypothetical protein
MTTFAPAMPHGPITKIADGVHVVRSGFRMGPGVVISRTMTIVETGDGLALLNAARLSDEAHAELERIGPIKHLIKLSDSHGLDEPYFVDRYKPEVWTLEGVTSIAGTRRLGPDSPMRDGRVLALPGAKGWREVMYWAPNGGGTLIACDALQNHVDLEGTSLMARLVTPLMGFTGGLIVPSMWRKYQKIAGAQVRAAFAPALALSFVNVVTGHGPAITGDADTETRTAVASASASVKTS